MASLISRAACGSVRRYVRKIVHDVIARHGNLDSYYVRVVLKRENPGPGNLLLLYHADGDTSVLANINNVRVIH